MMHIFELIDYINDSQVTSRRDKVSIVVELTTQHYKRLPPNFDRLLVLIFSASELREYHMRLQQMNHEPYRYDLLKFVS